MFAATSWRASRPANAIHVHLKGINTHTQWHFLNAQVAAQERRVTKLRVFIYLFAHTQKHDYARIRTESDTAGE